MIMDVVWADLSPPLPHITLSALSEGDVAVLSYRGGQPRSRLSCSGLTDSNLVKGDVKQLLSLRSLSPTLCF